MTPEKHIDRITNQINELIKGSYYQSQLATLLNFDISNWVKRHEPYLKIMGANSTLEKEFIKYCEIKIESIS